MLWRREKRSQDHGLPQLASAGSSTSRSGGRSCTDRLRSISRANWMAPVRLRGHLDAVEYRVRIRLPVDRWPRIRRPHSARRRRHRPIDAPAARADLWCVHPDQQCRFAGSCPVCTAENALASLVLRSPSGWVTTSNPRFQPVGSPSQARTRLGTRLALTAASVSDRAAAASAAACSG